MSPPQATIDALGCHVKGPGSGTAGRETNHVFRNRTTSEMQITDRDLGRGRLRAAHHIQDPHMRCLRGVHIRAGQFVTSDTLSFSSRGARTGAHGLARQRPGKRTRVPRVATEPAFSHRRTWNGHGLTLSLTHSNRHTRHTTDTKGSVARGVGNRRNNCAAAGLLQGRALRPSFHPLRAHAQSSSTRPGS